MRRYVVVPDDNVYNQHTDTLSTSFLRRMSTHFHRASMAAASESETFSGETGVVESEVGTIHVVDAVDLEETTLVSMTPDQAWKMSRAYPMLRVQEELFLRQMKAAPFLVTLKPARIPKPQSIRTMRIECKDSVTGKPVPLASLVILFNARTGTGLTASADEHGRFVTALPASAKVIAMVVAAPLAGYWPAEAAKVPVNMDGETVVTLAVVPIAAGAQDAIDLLVPGAQATDGAGVKIAIIDSGTDATDKVKIAYGLNTTGTEPPTLYGDNGSGHGSHVAGIVARVAPAAELYIYRVFTAGSDGASEFAIAKAIHDAVDQGCDLISMSLGQSSEPVAISRDARRARALGAVCIAAAGNDYMGPVSYPARSNNMVAVSALGAMDTWPEGARTGANIASTPAPVGNLFFATFSNCGPQVDFIAPGVGIISGVSATEIGVMDGTSMACPVVTGMIARLLSKNAGLMAAMRDQQRSDNIVKMASDSARPVGFGLNFEGGGMIK